MGPFLSLLFFPVAITCVHVSEPPLTCSFNNEACAIHGDSLIDSFNDIENIAECRRLCYDVDDCEFITYYGSNGYPFRNICQLFMSCDETLSCTECISETKGCYNICSKNIIGAVDDNMLDIIPDIGNEGDCWDLCGKTSGCEFYTFYLEDNPYHGTCVLLSSLQPPLQDCPTCVTGPRHCDGPGLCQFLYDGKTETHLMFTEPGVNISFSTTSGSFFTECQLRVLAVGGGAKGGYGGGGSGYIQYHTQTISDSKTQIIVVVGDHDQASTINIDNGDTVVAAAGRGVDGYSGGGGGKESYDGCYGGSAGGDGECSNGGSGTGEDITSYTLQNYQLSAGSGGHYYCNADRTYCYGGGGGGVLVNGAGPGDNRGGASWSDGEGYGGGGTFNRDTDSDGLSGFIILEIVSEYSQAQLSTTQASTSTYTYHPPTQTSS